MTFYQQVRSFFKKYDPSRIRLAKRIATTYRTPRSQKEVMKRLHTVYAAGGPSNFDFSIGKIEKSKVVEQVVADVAEEVNEEIADINEEDNNDGIQEVTG